MSHRVAAAAAKIARVFPACRLRWVGARAGRLLRASRGAEDDAHTYFIRLEDRATADGEPLILWRAAFQSHGFGMVHSLQAERLASSPTTT